MTAGQPAGPGSDPAERGGTTAGPGGGRPIKVVAFGGGHGLAASLRALRHCAPQLDLDITAVVTVGDNGGSSGRLRAERDAQLPPGDLRMALAALAGADPGHQRTVALMQHRFALVGKADRRDADDISAPGGTGRGGVSAAGGRDAVAPGGDGRSVPADVYAGHGVALGEDGRPSRADLAAGTGADRGAAGTGADLVTGTGADLVTGTGADRGAGTGADRGAAGTGVDPGAAGAGSDRGAGVDQAATDTGTDQGEAGPGPSGPGEAATGPADRRIASVGGRHDPLAGHAVGNLLLLGLLELLGDPVAALDHAAAMVGARGRVLPMASHAVGIEADVRGGDPARPNEIVTVRGQHAVAVTSGHVEALRIVPASPPACRPALAAIAEADWLIFGPGSWYTSVLPHLLVPELAEAIVTSPARRLVTLNLAADNETLGLSVADHLAALHWYLPRLRVDTVLADVKWVGEPEPVHRAARALGARLVLAPLAVAGGSPKHDPESLGAALVPVLGSDR